MDKVSKGSNEAPPQFDRNGYSRIKAICSRYGISPATIWRKVKEDTFPKPIKLSAGITCWKNCDLLNWEECSLQKRGANQ